MKFPLLVTAAGAVLFAAGCAHEEHQAHYAPVYSPGPMRDYSEPKSVFVIRPSGGVNSTAIVPSDHSIVDAVRESLRRNAEIAPIVPNIEIKANNGMVVLNGWVQSVEQKRQVGAIARDVTGVVAVNNQLVPLVDPTAPRPDAENQPQAANPLLDSANSGAGEGNNTNLLAPTAVPGGSDKLYQENNAGQGGQVPNTNNNQMR